jgi:hypothetical protein
VSLAREPGLAHHDGKQRAVDAVEVANDLRLDAVPHQPDRASRQQALGADAQHGFEEVDRRLAPERRIEALAEAGARGCGVADGRYDELIAAELEKTAMPDPVARRPVEHADGVAFPHPLPQHFARLVPVDQEHQRGTHRREKAVACRRALGRIVAGDEIEDAVLAETVRLLAIEP